ncbi:MAG: hypothetical protein V1689_02885 [Pseudomonadota bacterium]
MRLSGLGAISTYVNRSVPTVLDWIKNLGMPAKKLGGIWESDTALIDNWHKEEILRTKTKPPNGRRIGTRKGYRP